jgi:hypothetical protein
MGFFDKLKKKATEAIDKVQSEFSEEKTKRRNC